jgi:hypothetical protein
MISQPVGDNHESKPYMVGGARKMKIKLIGILILFSLVVGGCGAPPPEPTPVESPPVAETAVPGNGAEEAYPPPQIHLPIVGVQDPYPAPGENDEGSGNVSEGAGQLQKANIFIDSVTVLVRESDPPQVSLSVRGNLPTPCNQFAYELGQPDEQGRVNIEVYSLVDPDVACITVLQPFEEVIDLGTFLLEEHELLVNGTPVDEYNR